MKLLPHHHFPSLSNPAVNTCNFFSLSAGRFLTRSVGLWSTDLRFNWCRDDQQQLGNITLL
ncbi:MAG: hypothetical protein ABL876_17805 [Chitinophagaceae bacterium]